MIKQGILLALISFAVLASTTVGIFSNSNEPKIEGTSLRGQHVVYRGGGVYRLNPEFFAREGVVWDVVNLCVALPLFIASGVAALRGSLRARLILAGLLVYFWYVYLSSVMMYAMSVLFPVYVVIIALAPVAFFMTLWKIDVPSLPTQFSSRFPRRFFVGYSILVSAMLIILWTGRIAAVLRTGLLPEEYAGMATLGSQALDLGVIVPLVLSAAVLLIRKSSWGYFLISVSMTVGLMMFIAIPSWIVVPLVQDGKTSLIEAVPLFTVSLVGIAAAAILFLSVRKAPA